MRARHRPHPAAVLNALSDCFAAEHALAAKVERLGDRLTTDDLSALIAELDALGRVREPAIAGLRALGAHELADALDERGVGNWTPPDPWTRPRAYRFIIDDRLDDRPADG